MLYHSQKVFDFFFAVYIKNTPIFRLIIIFTGRKLNTVDSRQHLWCVVDHLLVSVLHLYIECCITFCITLFIMSILLLSTFINIRRDM